MGRAGLKDKESENPDVKYLMEHVCPTVIKGLHSLYKTQPEDPLDWLAGYLLNSNKAKQNENDILIRKENVQKLRKEYDEQQNIITKHKEEKEAKDLENKKIEDLCEEKLSKSEDLYDVLDVFCDHLQSFTNTT